jgi:restriction system protein
MWFLVFIFLAGVVFVFGVVLGRRIPSRQNLGEALVAHEISCLFHLPHALLNNLTFILPNGTTQVDHVLVASTGIFVIETKHYTGWIFGGERQAEWTQVIFKKKSRFQNPIRQNYAHVRTLQELLKLPDSAFFPIVVFTGDAEFKTDLGKQVLRLPQLMAFLMIDRPVLFDEEKLAQLVGILEINRLRRSLETDEYHINHLMERLGEKLKPAMSRSRPRAVGFVPGPTAPAPTRKPTTLPNVPKGDERYMPKIERSIQGDKRGVRPT